MLSLFRFGLVTLDLQHIDGWLQHLGLEEKITGRKIKNNKKRAKVVGLGWIWIHGEKF